jgi:asparagine synthase (glutamine-hydrolysing)
MSRKHVTVALSGDGGDELFGGYMTYCADRWARRFHTVPESVRKFGLDAVRRFWPVSDDKISFEYKLKRMLEGSLLTPDEAHFFWNGACSPSQIRELCPGLHGPNLQALFDLIPGPEQLGYLNRYLLVDHNYYLPDDILYKVDRMSMAHSLEVRPPLLDHRIVEFAASLPEHFKLRGASQKIILKELMKGKLPASILNRKKTGFDVPAHDWFRGALLPLLRDTLTPEAVGATGVFDYRAIDSLIRDHTKRRVNVGYHLWGLLTLFLWMKKWGIQAGTSGPVTQMAPVGALLTS